MGEKSVVQDWHSLLPWNHRLLALSQSALPWTVVGQGLSLRTQSILRTSTHIDLTLSYLLEITRAAVQKYSFVSLRSLKEALKDLKRNDLNKRTKGKKLESEQKFWSVWGWEQRPPWGALGKGSLLKGARIEEGTKDPVAWWFCSTGKLQPLPVERMHLTTLPRHACLGDFIGLPAVREGLDLGSWGFPHHTLYCSLKTQNDFLGLRIDQTGSFVRYTIVINSIVWCSVRNYMRAMGLW